jgi:5-methylcytosine-specific restriction endonuclease McrA
MFVDGKSIRLRIRTDDPDVPEIDAADVLTQDFAREHSRALTRAEVMGLAGWEAARAWTRQASVSTRTAYQRIRDGAKIPVRPGEVSPPTGLSFGDVVENTLFLLPQTACFYCGAPAGSDGLETDHAIPLLRGGKDRAENRLPACASCNQAKYDRTYEGFRVHMAGRHDLDTLPTFFGETGVGRQVIRYRFDPDALPDRLPSRPTDSGGIEDANRMETNTSRHLGL